MSTDGPATVRDARTAPGTARHAVRVLLVALLVACGCVAAGLWQWDRHEHRSAAIALVERNYGAEPAPLDALLAGGALAADDVWRSATVRGTYVGDPVLLRNRPVDGAAALHVLGALRVDGGPLAGAVLVVDRGWVPPGDDAGAPEVPAPPRGAVDVVVHLRPAEAASDRDAPPGQVQAIAPDQVRDALLAADPGATWPADATLDAYGAAITEDGARAAGLGTLAAPSRDPGSHLSYAFQWWAFALGALATGVVLVVRGVRERREAMASPEAPGTDAAPRPARPQRARRRPTAEEEEDALLDAQDARDARGAQDTQDPLEARRDPRAQDPRRSVSSPSQ